MITPPYQPSQSSPLKPIIILIIIRPVVVNNFTLTRITTTTTAITVTIVTTTIPIIIYCSLCVIGGIIAIAIILLLVDIIAGIVVTITTTIVIIMALIVIVIPSPPPRLLPHLCFPGLLNEKRLSPLHVFCLAVGHLFIFFEGILFTSFGSHACRSLRSLCLFESLNTSSDYMLKMVPAAILHCPVRRSQSPRRMSFVFQNKYRGDGGTKGPMGT